MQIKFIIHNYIILKYIQTYPPANIILSKINCQYSVAPPKRVIDAPDIKTHIANIGTLQKIKFRGVY